MKKVTFYQQENELTYELLKGGSIETLVGNFYEVVSDFKDSNAKLFNFSSPILLRVENVNEDNESELIMNTGLGLETATAQMQIAHGHKKGRVRVSKTMFLFAFVQHSDKLKLLP